ncbi:hypothetical protein EW146_g9660 [Bondarzewia mesenterica]|uniref:Uncharacterized protein n=1 Tax=Bondarzewia mesenterica TaxID=1095465 RepID=A0A4V3XCP0_9AGAM|nr:hypothetical protein EW146_g9660 [Bondarzewia mesenterica]
MDRSARRMIRDQVYPSRVAIHTRGESHVLDIFKPRRPPQTSFDDISDQESEDDDYVGELDDRCSVWSMWSMRSTRNTRSVELEQMAMIWYAEARKKEEEAMRLEGEARRKEKEASQLRAAAKQKEASVSYP